MDNYEELILIERFKEALKSVENSIKAGYDRNLHLWFPHKSLEGGLPTIGYGHKIKSADMRILLNGTYLLATEGLNNSTIEELFDKDFRHAFKVAKEQFEAEYPGLALSTKGYLILTNLVFNAGTLVKGGQWQWPKLVEALLENKHEEVRKQMVTSYYNPSLKKRVRLTQRATVIANALDVPFRNDSKIEKPVVEIKGEKTCSITSSPLRPFKRLLTWLKNKKVIGR
jgi:hypothetical protein